MKTSHARLIIIVLVGFTIVAIWFGVSMNLFKSVKQELPTPNFSIKEYSLNGTITAINGNVITLHVGRVFTNKDGNYIGYEDKKVTVTNQTIIARITNVRGNLIRESIKTTNFTVGNTIVVYSNEDISRQDSFAPTRLDIMF